MPLLIGTESSYDTNATNDFQFACKFTCSSSGYLSEIRVWSAVSGNVKVGIYSDNSGPDTLLAANNTGTACSASQWNSVSISSIYVTNGTDYWLSAIADTAGVICRTSATGVGTDRYKSSSYATGIPSTPPTWDGNLTYLFGIVGYGDYPSDKLLGGSFSYSGTNKTDTAIARDNLLSGSFSYSGTNKTDTATTRDKLLGGSFSYSGTNKTDDVVGDNLLSGSFSYSGTDKTDTAITRDKLLGGSFSYFGNNKTDLAASSIRDLAKNSVILGIQNQMIGYEEPQPPEEVLSLRMYNFLLYPIRQADSTREGTYFVKRLFEGPQIIWEENYEKIFKLKKLWSYTECPDEALTYLKNIVGWTDELSYITEDLDNDTLRRLIATSIPIWKRRGREETTINLLILLTSVKCFIWNWFDYRWIVDETEFTEQHQGHDPWITHNGSGGEYESTLRIVDDGTLDRALVKNIIMLMRAANERVEIAYIDFMDRFSTAGDTSQWETLLGDDLIVEDGYGKLQGSNYQITIVSVENSANWNRYVFYSRLKGGPVGYYGILFYYTNLNSYYELIINIESSSYDYVLNKIDGGTPVNVISGNLDNSIDPNVWYGIRIHVDSDGNSNRIRFYLGGEEIFNITDSSSLIKGKIAFLSAATTELNISECELFQLPLETELIDINPAR